MALDRLVSVQDYQDFTRVFAGIGKARAAELSDGRGQIVHLTIAGADDIPIEYHSDLYRNLTAALRRFGDPSQPFRIDRRELLLLSSARRCGSIPTTCGRGSSPGFVPPCSTLSASTVASSATMRCSASQSA